MQHKPAHPDFPSPRLSPQALSPQSQECALVAEEYSINWVSLLNPHCAPDPVLGLDKRRPFHLVLVGGWALPSYRLHRVREGGLQDLSCENGTGSYQCGSTASPTTMGMASERERGLAWGCQAQHGLIHGTDSQDFNLSMYLAHSKLAWPLGTSPPLLFHK